MTARLRLDHPELGLDLALGPGEACRLAATTAAAGDPGGGSVPVADPEAVVSWLRGSRGPWRPGGLVLDGRRLGHRREAARVRAGLVVVGDAPLAAEVSLVDHLAVAVSPRRAGAALDATPRLAGRSQDPAGVLSGGERRLLAWARAALALPRVVVLDRAATGLDAEAVRWATRQVRTWRAEGVTVVVRDGRQEEADWASSERPNGRVSGPHGGGPPGATRQ